jgi:hypothetical protein
MQGWPIMQESVIHRAAPWLGSMTTRLRRSGRSAREQLAHYLSEIAAYWNRQPVDRFWPPHP